MNSHFDHLLFVYYAEKQGFLKRKNYCFPRRDGSAAMPARTLPLFLFFKQIRNKGSASTVSATSAS